MNKHYFRSVVTAGLLALSLAAPAEDIDLFVNQPSTVDAPMPNVLIIVDNTANWNTAFTNEMAALADTLTSLPENAFRIGILFSAETGSPNNSTEGGYVRAAIRDMTAANKIAYTNLVNSFDKNADKGNGGQASLVMAEAYRYLAGGVPHAGNFKVKTDYLYNTSGTTADKAVCALPNNALSAFDGTQYSSPVQSGCQKNFIIYISNGASQDNTSVITQSTSMLAAAALEAGISGATTPIAISPTGSQDNVSDEWARFMKNSALGVRTYTIDVDKVTTGQGPGWTALLKSMATVSEGAYFDVASGGTGEAIKKAMDEILSQIQSVNSAFASVSLPVSVNTQGTYLNQVFIGMFRPDKDSGARWAGNLKQYKMGYDASGQFGTLDADNRNAINSITGFIDECARSFWTAPVGDTDNWVNDYWANKPQGGCLAVLNSAKHDSPDGNIVEKGAQAFNLRSTTTPATRNVLTCTACGNDSTPANFDSDNSAITKTLLGDAGMTDADRTALIDWARGENNSENELSKGLTAMRPSVHGDVVHSRPVAINYAASGAAPDVVIYYGANDGMLRAVSGNRDGGTELWSFMAPEFYQHIKRLRDNTIPINYFGSTSGDPKPYGFDGPVTAYKEGSSTWIYATMRRGGNAVYAFDVSNRTAPQLKWKHDAASLDNLGQTWSAPKVLNATGYASPLLIMGGGYDTCEDADPHVCDTSTKGNRVYLMDADDGEVLRTLTTDRAVVADVVVVPDRVTGLAKYAYVVDLGGNVYRIDIGTAAPADWSITKIASLGGTGTNARKFMFAPDVVEDYGAYILLLGSGDREKPLAGYTAAAGVNNYFFMLKDDPAVTPVLTDCGGSSVICMNSLYPIVGDSSPTLATVAEKKGWYLDLKPTEQVVTSAITIFGTVTFSTHEPAPIIADPNVCTSTLGTACVYNISYANATSMNGTTDRCKVVAGGGLPPSPVAGMVTLDGVDTDGDGVEDVPGETVPFCFGCDAESPLKAVPPEPPPPAIQPKSRVYWNIQQ